MHFVPRSVALPLMVLALASCTSLHDFDMPSPDAAVRETHADAAEAAAVALADASSAAANATTLVLAPGLTSQCAAMWGRVVDERAALLETADRSCTVAGDCIAAREYWCSFGCGLQAFSGRGAEAESMSAGNMSVGVCREFEQAGCYFADRLPCPPVVRNLDCVAGRCAVVEGTASQASACALPFDEGTGFDRVDAYWFDAQTKTCVLRYYTGLGGNANMAATREGCEAACLADARCPVGRALAHGVCTMAGPRTECVETADIRCAKRCTSDAECAGENLGQACVADATGLRVCGAAHFVDAR